MSPGSWRVLPSALGGLACLVCVRTAAAAEPVAVRVTYEAPAGCPDAQAFDDELRRRTPRVRSTPDGAEGQAFVLLVVVAGSARGFGGTLGVTGPTGDRSSRSLSAGTCTEVIDALALMAALAIDPEGLAEASRAASPPVSPPAPPTPPPAPPLPPPPPAGSPPVVAERASAETPRPQPPPPEHPARPRPFRLPFTLAAGAGAAVSWGVTPAVIFAPVGFVEVERPFRGRLGLDLRAGFERGSRSDVGNSSGQANFTWTVGTVDACPLRLSFRTLVALPCVRVEAGSLDGTGVTGAPNHTANQGWLAAALLGRLRWTPIPHVSAEVEGGLRASFIRHTFEFQPSTRIYTPAPVSGLLGANLRASF